MQHIDEIIESQCKYFQSGETLLIKTRIFHLKKLKETIKKYEEEINDALKKDLGKSSFESYMCEVGMTLSEISYMIKHISKFSKDKRVRTPIAQFASKSYKKTSPYGNVLIISPWNYPFLLAMGPLVDALAAGNTAIIKPSEFSINTSQIIKKIIKECFKEEYVSVVKGGIEESSYLLTKKFDFIFFTGSQNVGKIVLQSASKYLTPVVLELGGKSPCIVDESANIELTAKRIVFGKFVNTGQTCVAPDYILCHKVVKEELIKEIVKQIEIQYTIDPLNNDNYGRIINIKHFDRLNNLIENSKIIYGGKSDSTTLKIEPTILDNVSWNDKIMQQEIFGPILPILTFDNINEIYDLLKDKSKPLALYLFSKNKKNINFIMNRCQYGGGCINDTIIHLATTEMGFGGVGESGMGSYHGKVGFETFSHTKSIVDKKTWIDLPMRYQPYKKGFIEKLIHFFLK